MTRIDVRALWSLLFHSRMVAFQTTPMQVHYMFCDL